MADNKLLLCDFMEKLLNIKKKTLIIYNLVIYKKNRNLKQKKLQLVNCKM